MSNLIDKHFYLVKPTLLDESKLTYVDSGILEIQGINEKPDGTYSAPLSACSMSLIPNVLNGISFECIANSAMAHLRAKGNIHEINKFYVTLRRPSFSSVGKAIDYICTATDKTDKNLKMLLTEVEKAHEEWKKYTTCYDIHTEFDNNHGLLVLLCMYIKYICNIARSHGVYIDDELNYEGFYNDTDHIYVRRRDFNDFLSWFLNKKMVMKEWIPGFLNENKKYIIETHKIHSSTTMLKIHKELVSKILEKEFSNEAGFIEDNKMPISEYLAKTLMIYIKG